MAKPSSLINGKYHELKNHTVMFSNTIKVFYFLLSNSWQNQYTLHTFLPGCPLLLSFLPLSFSEAMFPNDANDMSLSETAKFTEKGASIGGGKYSVPNNATHLLKNYQCQVVLIDINREIKRMSFE